MQFSPESESESAGYDESLKSFKILAQSDGDLSHFRAKKHVSFNAVNKARPVFKKPSLDLNELNGSIISNSDKKSPQSPKTDNGKHKRR